MPVTAPRRTSAWASSKFVSPTLYPGCRPSTATRTMRPSARCPTAERGARWPSWLDVNFSLARNTGDTVADDLRPAADSRDEGVPLGQQVEPHRQGLTRYGFGGECRRCSAGAEQDGAARRDGNGPGRRPLLDDGGRQVDTRGRQREREQHDSRGSRDGRRCQPVDRREQSDTTDGGPVVEPAQCACRACGVPGAAQRGAANVERPVSQHPGARACRVRGDGELAVPHEDAARPPGREREQVAVDPGARGRPREPALHARQGLPALHPVVREDRRERRAGGAVGARADEDVERHRPVGRELHARLVGDSGPERRLLRARSRGECSREHGGDGEQETQTAEHDPGRD